MLTLELPPLIHALNHISPALLWIAQLVFVYSSILFMLRFAGRTGLFVLIGLLLVAANIQVNKLTLLPGFSDPIPLGNVFIAGTYLCSDTLAEYFSAKAARRAIWLGFLSFILIISFILLTLGFKPLSPSLVAQSGLADQQQFQNALLTVFGTAPALLVASLTSFLISQFFDITLFTRLKKITAGRMLWLRNNVSTLAAALLDSFIFNLLAFRLFATHPIPWHTLLVSYMFGTYLIRVIVSVFDTPFIYLAKYFMPKKYNSNTTYNPNRQKQIKQKG